MIKESNDLELYELIFCSDYGAKNRQKLLKEDKDKIEMLKSMHEKYGMRINGKVVSFKNCIK